MKKICETNEKSIHHTIRTYMKAYQFTNSNSGDEAIKAVLYSKKQIIYFLPDIYNKVDGKVHYTKTYEEHLDKCEKLGLNL